jgi:multicomponent Na+:H+ antiporter subunit D
MNNLLPLFVAIPLAAAFFIPMVSKKIRFMPDLLGNLTMVSLAALAVMSLDKTGIYHMGGWATHIGIDLRLDALSSMMLLAISVIGLAATLYSVQYMNMYTSKLRYYSLFLFMIAGMNGVVLAGDLFNLYVFMEIAAIASYALVGFGCEHEELEASFKYAVLGSLASAFILIGIALLYGITGTLNMQHIAAKLPEVARTPASRPMLMAFGMFLCGFGLKAALVPFHAWLPDAHPSAPAPVSAMLSGVVIKALGIYVLARLIFNVFGVTTDITGRFLQIIRLLGLVSMVVGVFLAIGQWDMKRLFAYHSISQIGYVAIGIGLGTPLGIIGGLFHMMNHSVFKSLLFLNAGAVEYATGTRDLKRLGGLNTKMPVTANTSLVASMSIAGIPPFNGFWSKLIIIWACVESGHYWLAVAAVFVSLMTLASFLKVQRYAFFGSVKTAVSSIREVPLLMRAAMLLLAVLCILMSLMVVGGIETPYIIGDAMKVLTNGVFAAP